MDRISKAQKADVLTQFSEMKFNEGVISEKKRIASIIIEGCMTMEEFILKYAKEKLSKIIKC